MRLADRDALPYHPAMPAPSPAAPSSNAPQPLETNIVDTLQSLIVAFVLAMTFRGFVTEGFVIPTGSMAPTLMGAHALLHSDQTGIDYAVGVEQDMPPPFPGDRRLVDPMLGPTYPGTGPVTPPPGKRMGDRILVLKSLYPFSEPKRFDVVVFKNPTKPVGDEGNYIKRLIGLPNEQIWLVDGDVFSKRDGESEFKIRRKPEHVQRAVWQLVHQSDFVPIDPDRLAQRLSETSGRKYNGPPWVAADNDKIDWKIQGRRSYEYASATATSLKWNADERAIDDWTAYDMLMNNWPYPAVSDVRVSAGIVATQAGFQTTFELTARSHVFEFHVQADNAYVRMRSPRDGLLKHEWSAPIRLPEPGKVFDLEFWHVDQAVSIYLNGKRVVYGEYDDWTPEQRLQFATGKITESSVRDLVQAPVQPCAINWRFEGSPFTLHRVRLDRDLYYRAAMLNPKPENQKNPPQMTGFGFGVFPFERMRYGPDADQSTENGRLGPDQFMMCGDNSQMSLDSRLWGRPHPLVSQEIDGTPFIVNRKLLLGKAWVVYFPAPFTVTSGGYPVVPDFGRLRFIR